ncbi:MAG: hypothetical protein LUE13_04280 [Akkermansiaceae bacterium]|nr:hypothetical protein [Akkermansiaceae bacterium]
MDLTGIQITDGTLPLKITGNSKGTAVNKAMIWMVPQQVPEPPSCTLFLLGF